MEKIKLRPCPFCGVEAEIFRGTSLNIGKEYEDHYTVRCRSCFNGTGLYKDPGRAAEVWNRRVEDGCD